jgi:hypothetical protein
MGGYAQVILGVWEQTGLVKKVEEQSSHRYTWVDSSLLRYKVGKLTFLRRLLGYFVYLCFWLGVVCCVYSFDCFADCWFYGLE